MSTKVALTGYDYSVEPAFHQEIRCDAWNLSADPDGGVCVYIGQALDGVQMQLVVTEAELKELGFVPVGSPVPCCLGNDADAFETEEFAEDDQPFRIVAFDTGDPETAFGTYSLHDHSGLRRGDTFTVSPDCD